MEYVQYLREAGFAAVCAWFMWRDVVLIRELIKALHDQATVLRVVAHTLDLPDEQAKSLPPRPKE